MAYTVIFVLIFTVSSIWLIAEHLVNNRLDMAIEDAVSNTEQVKILSKELPSTDLSLLNTQGEYYKLVDEKHKNLSYKLLLLKERYYIEVYAPSDRENFSFRGRFDVTYIIEESRYVKQFMMMATLIIGILTIMTSYVFSRKMTKNINKLNSMTQDMSQGNYSKRVVIKSRDEIGSLGRSFNTMADHTESYLQELNVTALKNKKLFSSLTHEINTPLTSIIGYSELLLTQPYNMELFNKSLRHINQEGKRLSVLSHNLLSLSNKKIDREMVDLHSLIEESINTCRTGREKAIDYVLKGQLELPVDRGLMKAVIVNLINNSIDAIRDSGTVVLELFHDKLLVSDTGSGIQTEDIFEPFAKGNEDKHHLGLGLSLVKDILNLHGDQITCVSSAQGTTMTLHFTSSLQVKDNFNKSPVYPIGKEGLS